MLSIFYSMKAKHSIKNTITAIIIALLLMAAAIFCLTAFNRPASGSIRVRAINAYTLEPVANAKIVIAECKKAAYTDVNGFAYIYDVPVYRNELFYQNLGCDWGEVSIFSYADGYLPLALLHARVYENNLRLGPSLYMFPEGETGVRITTLIESPDEDEMQKLADMLFDCES